jgi:hypothetical protein
MPAIALLRHAARFVIAVASSRVPQPADRKRLTLRDPTTMSRDMASFHCPKCGQLISVTDERMTCTVCAAVTRVRRPNEAESPQVAPIALSAYQPLVRASQKRGPRWWPLLILLAGITASCMLLFKFVSWLGPNKSHEPAVQSAVQGVLQIVDRANPNAIGVFELTMSGFAGRRVTVEEAERIGGRERTASAMLSAVCRLQIEYPNKLRFQNHLDQITARYKDVFPGQIAANAWNRVERGDDPSVIAAETRRALDEHD